MAQAQMVWPSPGAKCRHSLGKARPGCRVCRGRRRPGDGPPCRPRGACRLTPQQTRSASAGHALPWLGHVSGHLRGHRVLARLTRCLLAASPSGSREARVKRGSPPPGSEILSLWIEAPVLLTLLAEDSICQVCAAKPAPTQKRIRGWGLRPAGTDGPWSTGGRFQPLTSRGQRPELLPSVSRPGRENLPYSCGVELIRHLLKARAAARSFIMRCYCISFKEIRNSNSEAHSPWAQSTRYSALQQKGKNGLSQQPTSITQVINPTGGLSA